jgi:hypothetical protein
MVIPHKSSPTFHLTQPLQESDLDASDGSDGNNSDGNNSDGNNSVESTEAEMRALLVKMGRDYFHQYTQSGRKMGRASGDDRSGNGSDESASRPQPQSLYQRTTEATTTAADTTKPASTRQPLHTPYQQAPPQAYQAHQAHQTQHAHQVRTPKSHQSLQSHSEPPSPFDLAARLAVLESTQSPHGNSHRVEQHVSELTAVFSTWMSVVESQRIQQSRDVEAAAREWRENAELMYKKLSSPPPQPQPQPQPTLAPAATGNPGGTLTIEDVARLVDERLAAAETEKKKEISSLQAELSRLRGENESFRETFLSPAKEREVSDLKVEVSRLRDENENIKRAFMSPAKENEVELFDLREEMSKLREENESIRRTLLLSPRKEKEVSDLKAEMSRIKEENKSIRMTFMSPSKADAAAEEKNERSKVNVAEGKSDTDWEKEAQQASPLPPSSPPPATKVERGRSVFSEMALADGVAWTHHDEDEEDEQVTSVGSGENEEHVSRWGNFLYKLPQAFNLAGNPPDVDSKS